MPATIALSQAEAALLIAHKTPGIEDGSTFFTYAPADSLKILGSLDKASDAYPALAGRMAAVASQLGCPDVMFAKPASKQKSSSADTNPPTADEAAPVPQAQDVELPAEPLHEEEAHAN